MQHIVIKLFLYYTSTLCKKIKALFLMQKLNRENIIVNLGDPSQATRIVKINATRLFKPYSVTKMDITLRLGNLSNNIANRYKVEPPKWYLHNITQSNKKTRKQITLEFYSYNPPVSTLDYSYELYLIEVSRLLKSL